MLGARPPANREPFVVAYRASLPARGEAADGRVVTGIVVAERDGSVTLRTAEGTDVTIPRADVESFASTKRSLMPEGFEKTIDARGMADLIAYLMSAR